MSHPQSIRSTSSQTFQDTEDPAGKGGSRAQGAGSCHQAWRKTARIPQRKGEGNSAAAGKILSIWVYVLSVFSFQTDVENWCFLNFYFRSYFCLFFFICFSINNFTHSIFAGGCKELHHLGELGPANRRSSGQSKELQLCHRQRRTSCETDGAAVKRLSQKTTGLRPVSSNLDYLQTRTLSYLINQEISEAFPSADNFSHRHENMSLSWEWDHVSVCTWICDGQFNTQGHSAFIFHVPVLFSSLFGFCTWSLLSSHDMYVSKLTFIGVSAELVWDPFIFFTYKY